MTKKYINTKIIFVFGGIKMSIGILIVSIFALVFYLAAIICYFVRRSLTRIMELIGVALLLTFTIMAMINKFSFGEYSQAVIILLLITLICLTLLRIFGFVNLNVSTGRRSSSKRK